MATYWEFYHTSNNPTGLTTTVGGTISTNFLAGNLNELFTYVDAPPSGTDLSTTQYRKIHIKNPSSTTLTGVRMWLDSIEHDDQIAIGIEVTGGQDAPNANTLPTSVIFSQPTTYNTGVSLGTLAASFHTGIWLRQTLSGIHEPDPYASFRVNIGGTE
jgi:hypothetical protein|tara:strand:+ start:209 stop:682 length:474 start_codon:yes stop_codon:yes gene_type:complete